MSLVAFIGLGNMGGPMAKNLIKAGHEVTVFDLMPAACADLQQSGAAVAGSAAEAVAGKEYVISMLPAGKHVAATYLGDDGLLASWMRVPRYWTAAPLTLKPREPWERRHLQPVLVLWILPFPGVLRPPPPVLWHLCVAAAQKPLRGQK